MYKFFVILKRDFINIILNPALLLHVTVFPILLIVVLGALTKNNYGDSGVTSYDYYGVSIMVYMALNVCMIASNSFMEKSLKDTNLRVMHTPINTWYIYVSKILATFIFASVSFVVIMSGLSFYPGINFGYLGYTMGIIISFTFMSSALGVFFCCILKSEELSNKILSIVGILFAMLGGVFFPLDSFGDAVIKLSCISPVRWAAKAMYESIYDKNTTMLFPVILIFMAIGFCLGVGCKYFFKMEDYV